MNKKIYLSFNNKEKIFKNPNKKYQCAILSKEVNDIISNYTKRNQLNENINIDEEINLPKKNTIYDYNNSEINIKENKINSFLNRTKTISLNNTKNLSARYNYVTEPNNNSHLMKKLNHESCELCGCNNKNLNDKNNKRIYTRINYEYNLNDDKKINTHNNMSIDFSSNKLLNPYMKPDLSSHFLNNNRKLNTSKSKSITSLKDINFDFYRNNQKINIKYNNCYDNKAFNNSGSNNNSFYMNKCKYNHSERNSYNNKIQ